MPGSGNGRGADKNGISERTNKNKLFSWEGGSEKKKLFCRINIFYNVLPPTSLPTGTVYSGNRIKNKSVCFGNGERFFFYWLKQKPFVERKKQ